MNEEGKTSFNPAVTPPKKGCNISLMFPIDTDAEALAIKAKFDEAVSGLNHKRYTFQISEMD